jgi:PiT family inorganic phosphate transporter
MIIALLVITVFWLAYSNGSNDNFKGVATLYGSDTASFTRALVWATLATVAGSLISLVAADKLLDVFSGKGLVPEALVGAPQLLVAVGSGSAMTVLLATRFGMPTSTTHALTGALLGIALITSYHGIPWSAMFQSVAGPLLLSPIIAVIATAISYVPLRRIRSAFGVTRQTCVCLESTAPEPVHVQSDGSLVVTSSGLCLRVDQVEHCVERYQGQIVGVDAQRVVDAVHYLSAGAVCFGRAVNDTPKIAALLFALQGKIPVEGLVLIAVGMTIGGLVHSRRVAETMSKQIADLNPGQGLTANIVTACLVLFASRWGLPVSTTHVACGSIFGIGVINRTCRWGTAAEIAAAWLTTLPLAALLSGVFFLLITEVEGVLL